jgi:hypothetical protein
MGLNTSGAPSGTMHIVSNAATDRTLILQRHASQSVNMTEWRDSGGSVIASVDNNGNFSTVDLTSTGRIDAAAHANNVGMNLPTNAGVPAAVTGTAEGDVVYDTTNNSLYVYDGAAFSEISASGIPTLPIDVQGADEILELNAAGQPFFRHLNADNVLAWGANAGANLTDGDGAQNNILIGSSAGAALTTADSSIFIGTSAGAVTTVGTENTFIGHESGIANTDGSFNTFLGFRSGNKNTEGDQNVYVGYRAGFNATTAAGNSIVGYQAGFNNLTGGSNVFLGYTAGHSNTSGSQNVFIGREAGYNNAGGLYNVFSGYRAGYNNTASSNVFSGYRAGFNNTTGANNVFIGYQTGFSNTQGLFNFFAGRQAGNATTTGDRNIFIGYLAGGNNTLGNRNVIIGNEVDNLTNSTDDYLNIYNAIYGDMGTTTATASADAALTIDGDLTLVDLTATGRVDASAHGNNVGMNLPTNAGAPAAVTGTAEGDVVYDTTNDHLYVYDGAAFSQVGGGGSSVWSLNGSDAFYSAGDVGIGTNTPTTHLQIEGSGANVGGQNTHVEIFDTTAPTAGVGARIMLSGRFNGTPTNVARYGAIAGLKENGTSGDYASAMTFYTRENGSALTEQMRISSEGHVTIGGDLTLGGSITNLLPIDVTGSDRILEFDSANDKFLTYVNGAETLALGKDAGAANTSSGLRGTYIGDRAGEAITSGNNNTIVGHRAGRLLTTQGGNTLVGTYAGDRMRASNTTIVGFQAGFLLTNGLSNTFIGASAGYSTTGNRNLMVGLNAGQNTTSGDHNTFLGHLAADNNTTGDYNIIIGSSIDNNTSTTNRYINIGNTIYGDMGTPTSKNTTNATIAIDGSLSLGKGSSPSYVLEVVSAADTNIMSLQDSDGTCLHNPESGGVTISCSSDRRLKEDIADKNTAARR